MILLREIERDDIEKIRAWRRDPSVYNGLIGAFRHTNSEVDEQWLDRYLSAREHEVRLAVILEESNVMVGVVYLLRIDWLARSAQLGLMIGEKEYWGRGIGTEATRLALRHAFDDLNLHRVYLTVLEGHAAAIRAYEKAGFVQEGLFRDAAYKQGRYRSLISMAVVRPEPEKSTEPSYALVGEAYER